MTADTRRTGAAADPVGDPVDPGEGGAVLPAWGIDVPDDAS